MTILIEPNDYTDPTRPPNPGDPYVALVDPQNVTPLKITSIPTLGAIISLTQTLVPPDPWVTKISHLHLGRFAEPSLDWNYLSDGMAELVIKLIETPDEYTVPQADLPEPAFLYVFTEMMPTPLVTRFTSYEQSITINQGGAWDGVYAPGPFEHGKITQGVKLEEEKCDVSSFDFSMTNNPLRKCLEFSLEGKLRVDVLEVDFNHLEVAPEVIFSGEYATLDPKGKEWKATFRAFGEYFQRQFSRCYYQRICNVHVYSPKCGVNKAAFLSDGTLYSIAGDGSYFDVAPIAGHADPSTRAADYFAGGQIETGAGANFERRSITHSVAVGGRVRLYVRKPLLKAVLTQVVNIYPGCNGAVETCAGVFNNLPNFRGFPYIPDKDPTKQVGQVDTATTGKK